MLTRFVFATATAAAILAVAQHAAPLQRKAALLTVAMQSSPLQGVAGTQVSAAQGEKPEWCKGLPRPESKTLERVPVSDAWFEVYKVAANTFAIYEPHQSEETIVYLIVGSKNAILFDTGMGISDIKRITEELTQIPIIVLNSHSHNDHVGGNWEFKNIYGMDLDFTRTNAKGSSAAAQEEIGPGQICGNLPRDFDAKTYATKPWKIKTYMQDGDRIDLGDRVIEVFSTPGHTPDAISILDRANGLLFTGDTFYPGEIWLYRPETNLDEYVASVKKLAALEPQLKLVLGAHNVAGSPPSVLPKLVAAIEAVRAGKVDAKQLGDGKARYQVGDISFLLHPTQ